MIASQFITVPLYAEEVEAGLTGYPKSLPAKLFYDAAGSALFEEITQLPEYYLTRTELGILQDRAGEIAAAVGSGAAVVELGAGTAAKTCTLLQALVKRQMRVPYYPVDISSSALAGARERVVTEVDRVSVRPVIADFADGFDFLSSVPGRKLVLYLGSSIGNFDPEAAVLMLSQIHAKLSSGDSLLIGTDMVKKTKVLLPAYDDAQGVTAEFNKNMLLRLNRELGANFDLDAFRHVARWNAEHSRMEMHLKSMRMQTVEISSLRMRIEFLPGERIHTENSYKYTMPAVRKMLSRAGFQLAQSWFDRKKWFGLHLARA